MNDLVKQEEEMLERMFQEVIAAYAVRNPEGKFALITKAYNFAKSAHEGMRRRSGEPYIIHPLSVAQIVSKDLEKGATCISAALLHDVVEDTNCTIEDLEDLFGEGVATLVEGLTKLSGRIFDDEEVSLQANNFRKLLAAMSKDARVILIKMADRLHNMRTLDSMPPDKQYKISAETLYIYAPLAHRLGMYQMKTELEDLSFKYEHPDIYQSISDKINRSAQGLDALFEEFVIPIRKRLEALNMKVNIQKRIKSVYSIWKKMESHGIPFEEVYDLMATRIVFEPRDSQNEKSQCWEIYGVITALYKLKDNRVRDWISSPKSNNYEALHLTVMGSQGVFVEVQIRSTRMDDIAEKGYAAHWKYKTNVTVETELDRWMNSFRDQIREPDSNSVELLENLRLNLYSDEIFVFTPKGEIRTLPRGASVLDFAYAIHTELGMHCIGAKVNKKLVAASHVLRGGDQIEILTSSKQMPQLQWKNFVVSAVAQEKLKTYFNKKRETDLNRGKLLFRESLEILKIEHTQRVTHKVLDYYKVSSLEDLYLGLANNLYVIKLDAFPNIVKNKPESKIIQYWNYKIRGKKAKEEDTQDQALLSETNQYEVSVCCNPIPGDDTIGYKQPNNKGIIIHKRQCPKAISLMSQFGDRLVNVDLASLQETLSYHTAIELKGIDRIGIVSEITQIISKDNEVNIRSIHFDSVDGVFEGLIEIYVQHITNANTLINKLNKVDGVQSVARINKPQN